MRNVGKVLQIAFTYMGTIVGAGFATGQEILHFFTRYGHMAMLTIIVASIVFVWIGTKTMLIAHDFKAHSYEALNTYLFGNKLAPWVNILTFIILFGITSVMLAGAGTIFSEHLHLSFQFGLIFTMLLTYLILLRGIAAILAVNTVVVPCILTFMVILVATTWHSPSAANWVQLESDFSTWQIWLSPFLYTAFNLALAQAVLVPIGSSISNRSILYWGGIVGGIGIGLMLFASHFVLASLMPAVTQFEIPMGIALIDLGKWVQLLFLIVIFAEIFTTFIADVYGLTRQIGQRIRHSEQVIIASILIGSYCISQIGFKTLLSTLYPLFGAVSLTWLVMMFRRIIRRYTDDRAR